jgi:nuclear pore complex protein Nup50
LLQEEKKNAFSSFAGFGTSNALTKKSDSAPAPSPFSFLSSSNGISKSPLSNLSNEKLTTSSKDTECNVDYLSRLKGLNESVLDWLKMHISKNPCCILTPVFNDYNKYLEVIRKETDNSEKKQVDEVDSETKQSPAKVISPESSKTKDESEKPTLSSTTSTAPIFPPFKTDKNPWESIAKSPSIFANNSESKEKSGFKLGEPASTTTSGFTFGK